MHACLVLSLQMHALTKAYGGDVIDPCKSSSIVLVMGKDTSID